MAHTKAFSSLLVGDGSAVGLAPHKANGKGEVARWATSERYLFCSVSTQAPHLLSVCGGFFGLVGCSGWSLDAVFGGGGGVRVREVCLCGVGVCDCCSGY